MGKTIINIKCVLVLILLSYNVQSQQYFFAHNYTTPVAANLLLDTYTGSSAAYSLRKLRTAYSGSCVRVRRNSDNTEQDIGFISDVIDTAAIKTFTGSNIALVTKWYDQSGNANDIVQATSLYQPTIFEYLTGGFKYIGNKICVEFKGGQNVLARAGLISGAVSRTQLVVYKNLKATAPVYESSIFGQSISPATTGSFSMLEIRNSTNTGNPYFLGFGANMGNGLSSVDSVQKIASFSYSGTTGYLWKNNTQLTSGALTLNANVSGVLAIGGSGTVTSTPFVGYVQECILYLTNQLSNISGINTNINTYYTIY